MGGIIMQLIVILRADKFLTVQHWETSLVMAQLTSKSQKIQQEVVVVRGVPNSLILEKPFH